MFISTPDAYMCILIFLANVETKQKHEAICEKNSWFKNTFLDSTRKLKEEVHEDLKRYNIFVILIYANFYTARPTFPFHDILWI